MNPSFVIVCAFFVLACNAISMHSNANGRINGGTEAYFGQYPFAVAISVRTASTQFFCGGTILTNQFILTAGHCVNQAIHFSLTIGSVSLSELEDVNREHLDTETYIVHPQFNPTTLANDIGLIKLRLPILFTDYIDAVHFLPLDNLPALIPVTILGWGQTDRNSSSPVDRLHNVAVSSLSTEECRKVYGNQITTSMMCVQGNYNEGACIGDSGSPLVQILPTNHVVIAGVHSFLAPEGCGSTYPSGYTRVFPFVNWIKNETGFINP